MVAAMQADAIIKAMAGEIVLHAAYIEGEKRVSESNGLASFAVPAKEDEKATISPLVTPIPRSTSLSMRYDQRGGSGG